MRRFSGEEGTSGGGGDSARVLWQQDVAEDVTVKMLAGELGSCYAGLARVSPHVRNAPRAAWLRERVNGSEGAKFVSQGSVVGKLFTRSTTGN